MTVSRQVFAITLTAVFFQVSTVTTADGTKTKDLPYKFQAIF